MELNTSEVPWNGTDEVVWTFSAEARLTLGILQLILNTAMLVVFAFRKDLRTSFTIYIIFLLMANIIYATCQYPLEVIRQLYPHWILSRSACIFYIYQMWVVCPIAMHMHVLITLNRIWAIAFPVSYRNQHSKRMAVLLCGVMALYIHAIVFPLFVIDAVWHKNDVGRTGCSLRADAQRAYAVTAAIVTQDLPLVFVVGAYPFLLCKQLQRRKVGAMKIVDVVSREGRNATEMQSRHKQQLVIVTSQPSHRRNTSRPFLVLTLLTVSVCICWTPDQTHWTVSIFTPVADQPALRALFGLQAVLDPILFALSLKSFRTVIKHRLSALVSRRPRITVINATGSIEADDSHS